jgi:hypothetical protein
MYNSRRRLVSFRNCEFRVVMMHWDDFSDTLVGIRFQQVLLAASHPTQIHKVC